MRASISGIGTWFPPRLRHNHEYPAAFVEAAKTRLENALVDMKASDETEADRIASAYAAAEQGDPFLASVHRHIVEDDVLSWQAEAYAARAAVEDAGLDPAEIDCLMLYSVGIDRVTPTNAHKVAYEIGAHRAWAIGVDSACASAIAPLELARAMIESGRHKHVVIVASNLMTRLVPFMHPVSPTVGDGACALVVSASKHDGILGVKSVSHGDHYHSICVVRATDDAHDTPWYRAGSDVVLGSRDPERMRHLMRQTVAFGEETVRDAAALASVPVAALDVLCCTHPRKFIPYAIGELLGIPRERVPNTFERYAHVGACSVVLNLAEARATGLLVPGTKVALYSQGAGFTRAAAVLRWQPDAA